MNKAFLLAGTILFLTQPIVLAQNTINSNPNSTSGASSSTNSFYQQATVGAATPLRPARPFYPRQQIQNPSNPWQPANLLQPNTNLAPVGSVSPTNTLTQPTSVLNTPGTQQTPGFPTIPTYNVGAAPTQASVSVANPAVTTTTQ